MERTHRWALRSLAARTNPEQALFAIVQGGIWPALREASAAFLTAQPFDGFAIGGLAVGDKRAEREPITQMAAALLPADKPRYLMGVGTPARPRGGDGRGRRSLRLHLADAPRVAGDRVHVDRSREAHARVPRGPPNVPLDERCPVLDLQALHALVPAPPREVRGSRSDRGCYSIHNVTHYHQLMAEARRAIDEQRYTAWATETLAGLDRHEQSGNVAGA